MKPSLRFPIFAAVAALLSLPGQAAVPALFNYDLQSITVTDMTPAGRQFRPATRDHPVYYAAVSAGYHDFGGYIAGDRPVSRELVNRTVMTVLAKQGYLPATHDHQPDVIIVWTWGTLYAEWFPGAVGLPWQVNELRMRWFLGGAKLGLVDRDHAAFPELTLAPELHFAGGNAQALLDTARDDLYVAAVSAYDARLKEPTRATLLWNTRISAPSRGFWLPDALPAMLAIGGPFFGRETPQPVWIRASDKFKPNIHIGDLKVVDEINEATKRVVDLGPSK